MFNKNICLKRQPIFLDLLKMVGKNISHLNGGLLVNYHDRIRKNHLKTKKIFGMKPQNTFGANNYPKNTCQISEKQKNNIFSQKK